MYRGLGTTSKGYGWDSQTILAVFNKGLILRATSRYDVCGAIIELAQHGNTTENGTGWEIDHIKPVAAGGTDDLINLQPLQWQNNRAKGDKWPIGLPQSYRAVSARQAA